MNVDWQSVISTAVVGIGGTLAISGAATWIIKTALVEWLARETEAFKARLRTDADIELEKLKNSLQMTATEHQVRFSRMHEKRAKVIEELYRKLTHVYGSGERFVITSENNPTPPQNEEFGKLREELAEVSVFLEQHRIFLPENVCTLLDDFFGRIRGTVYTAGIFGGVKYATARTAQQGQEAFTKAYAEFDTVIPAVRKSLEAEFRRMLGVE
jgi:hypothetical protein